MTKHKKPGSLTASLLLAPALALGAVPAEAQKKTTPAVSRASLIEATRKSRPQEAIRQADILIARAKKAHDFPLLLEAEKVRWEQLQQLDWSQGKVIFQRLSDLGKLSWLSDADRAALKIFELRTYLDPYFYSLHHQQPVRQAYDPVDPSDWPREQFVTFYTRRVEELLSDLPLLAQSAERYISVFAQPGGGETLREGRTLASELLYQLTYPEVKDFQGLHKQVLQALQSLDKSKLPAYTASFIDQQSAIARVDELDRCARPTALQAEVEGFVQRWGKNAVINNYYGWIERSSVADGLAHAHALERIARLATALTKENQKELARAIQSARTASFGFDAPERLVGRRDFTLRIPVAYLVREVEVSVFPAPASYDPTQTAWEVAPSTRPVLTQRLAVELDSLGILRKPLSLSLRLPEAGAYQIVLTATQDKEARGTIKPSKQYLYSSDYVALEHRTSDRTAFQWLEALSGKPLAGASFLSYDASRWGKPAKQIGQVQSDSWGRFATGQAYRFHLAGSRDPLLAEVYPYGRHPQEYTEGVADPSQLLGFITADRPAYRPGQTAQFYGIVSRIYRQAERAEVASSIPLEVTILDASGKQTHKQRISTDALGRFSLSYILPSQGLTGKYQISVAPVVASSSSQSQSQSEQASWDTSFQVFEYKRMDSQLHLDMPRLPLQAGSKVTVTGSLRTLSGSPIAGAKLKYELKAKRYIWHFGDDDRSYPGHKYFPSSEELTTDDQGRFTLQLTLPELPSSEEEFSSGKRIAFPWYTYELTVETTDATGEKQRETLNLPAGRAVAKVTPSLAPLIDKQSKDQTFAFETDRFKEEVDLLVRYSIQQGGRTLVTDSLPADELADISKHLRTLPVGRYELHYTTEFSDSLSYTGTQAFYLFDSKKLSPLTELRAPLLLSNGTGEYSATEKPAVYWTSSLPGAYVFYEVYTGQGLLMEGLLRPEAGKMNALPIDLRKLKDLPEEIRVRFWTVRDGRLIEETTSLQRTQPKKTLTLHWESFRDRLQAGQQETWRLTLRTPEGKPAQGTAVATWMYDSALDAFGSLPRWSPSLRLSHYPWGKYGNAYRSYLEQEQEDALEPLSAWYERWQAEQAQGKFVGSALPSPEVLAQLEADASSRAIRYKEPMMLATASRDSFSLGRGETMALESTVTTFRGLRKSGSALGATPQTPQAPPQLRTSFAENAFFLPQLTTDKDGAVSWSFTAPERLTRWRLMVLAHNAGMDHQSDVQTIETYRPFSIRPALPRFLSEGDSVSLTTEVRNDSQKAQRGQLVLELFDPQSQQVLHREETTFDVARGKSQAYSLPVTGFAGRDSVGVRIWARGAEASDGEQHLLAVRSARQQLTERIAFTRQRAGRDSIALSPILPKAGQTTDLQTGQLDIRLNSHTAFFTLSALQGLSVSQGASAFSLATALYAQSLVSALRDVEGMRAWAKELLAKDPQTKDDKHPELQQTPWVGVNKREHADELALARQLLAPVATLESDRLLRQLEGLQDKDGLFSWYPGMSGSVYTTEAVLRLLERLPAERLEEAHRLRLRQLIQSGLRALERKAIAEHKRLTSKTSKGLAPYFSSFDYLALAADGKRFGFTATEAGKRAESFFRSRLKQEPLKLPLWLKPQAARIFLASGDRKLAEALAQSLREHLVTNELGSFFASLDASAYSWMDKSLPTVVETIQLLRLLGQGRSPEVEGMTRWVINQKRTSSWSNELTSAEAIHALLLGQSSQLASDFSELRLEVPLREGKQLTQTGHSLTASIPLSDLRPTDPQLLIEQAKPSIVWGSAVATYTVPKESVKSASGKELRLRREVFVVSEEGGKEVFRPLSEGHILRVGDRLRTRITIELDRAMDFLRLEDPRLGFAEPVNQLPGYTWGEGTGYYVEPKDQLTAFYFDHLTRGTYQLTYDQRVARAGVFRGGVTELVSCYAPEYGAHTAVAPTTTVLPLQGK